MKNKLIIWGVVIAIVGFFFGYIAGQGRAGTSALPAVSSQGSAASLMLDYGDGMVRTYGGLLIEAGATVLDITKAVIAKESLTIKTKDYGDMGQLIEQIGSKKNGDEGKYWQYWVNNVSSQVAASKLAAKAGDVIEWKFLNYK